MNKKGNYQKKKLLLEEVRGDTKSGLDIMN